MPPRYAYWTIILDGKPTAFRARTEEELLPTLRQLQSRHPDAVMRWFSRGRLWHSQDEERLARTAREAKRENRGRDWRPGGSHEDPRARFKIPRDEKRRRFRDRLSRDRGPASAPSKPPPDQQPGNDPVDRPGPRPRDGTPRGDSGTPRHENKRPWKPREGDRPWRPKGPPAQGERDRPWRPKGPPAQGERDRGWKPERPAGRKPGSDRGWRPPRPEGQGSSSGRSWNRNGPHGRRPGKPGGGGPKGGGGRGRGGSGGGRGGGSSR